MQLQADGQAQNIAKMQQDNVDQQAAYTKQHAVMVQDAKDQKSAYDVQKIEIADIQY